MGSSPSAEKRRQTRKTIRKVTSESNGPMARSTAASASRTPPTPKRYRRNPTLACLKSLFPSARRFNPSESTLRPHDHVEQHFIWQEKRRSRGHFGSVLFMLPRIKAPCFQPEPAGTA